jgi:hypothetical protein
MAAVVGAATKLTAARIVAVLAQRALFFLNGDADDGTKLLHGRYRDQHL